MYEQETLNAATGQSAQICCCVLHMYEQEDCQHSFCCATLQMYEQEIVNTAGNQSTKFCCPILLRVQG